eukprot:6208362-Pleurochrysis_carterae.AAC.1
MHGYVLRIKDSCVRCEWVRDDSKHDDALRSTERAAILRLYSYTNRVVRLTYLVVDFGRSFQPKGKARQAIVGIPEQLYVMIQARKGAIKKCDVVRFLNIDHKRPSLFNAAL